MIAILVIAASALSFLVPAYGPSCWYSFHDILARKAAYPFLAAGEGVMARFFSVFSNFHLNCDKGYIPLIADFPGYYLGDAPDAGVYLNRPLYPFLASLVFRAVRPFTAVPDFIISYGSALFINLLAMFGAAALLHYLARRWFDEQVAWIAVLLFLFSPFVHIFINQPIAEMVSAFTVIASLFLLDRYARAPSPAKLIVYSLLFGVLMLGKMIYALAFFVLFLAWHFRRLREGIVFLTVQVVPLALWFVIVRFWFRLPYYIHEASYGEASTKWLYQIFENGWQPAMFVVLDSLPHFFTNTVYGFLLIPLVLAVYGYYVWQNPAKRPLVWGWVGSFFLLSFIMRFWHPRLSFLLFPIVYALAAVGLHALGKRFGGWALYAPLAIILVLSSFVNAYQIIPYG